MIPSADSDTFLILRVSFAGILLYSLFHLIPNLPPVLPNDILKCGLTVYSTVVSSDYYY